MNKKAQELELRNIMQGLEEFATFMSFRGSNTSNLRILSVETVAQFDKQQAKKSSAKVIDLPNKAVARSHGNDQHIHRSLRFQDRQLH